VRRILETKKYVYTGAKSSLESKKNPENRTPCKKQIEKHLKIEKASPEQLKVWFWYESGFNFKVITRKNWCEKGSRKKVNETEKLI
jgi:hypothetical protein